MEFKKSVGAQSPKKRVPGLFSVIPQSMHLHKNECIYLSWKFGCWRYVTLEADIGKGTCGEMFSGLA